MPNIDSQITALQYNLGALYSLLGGSSEERQRFFEIHKGITSVADVRAAGQGTRADQRPGHRDPGLRPVRAEVRGRRGPAH